MTWSIFGFGKSQPKPLFATIAFWVGGRSKKLPNHWQLGMLKKPLLVVCQNWSHLQFAMIFINSLCVCVRAEMPIEPLATVRIKTWFSVVRGSSTPLNSTFKMVWQKQPNWKEMKIEYLGNTTLGCSNFTKYSMKKTVNDSNPPLEILFSNTGIINRLVHWICPFKVG